MNREWIEAQLSELPLYMYEFIDTDELLEVTPDSLRIRKRQLDPRLRKREAMKKQS